VSKIPEADRHGEAEIGVMPPETTTSTAERIRALDVLRGLVIVLMVIDHVRWFLSEARFDPTDPALTTPALFFTRWVTHFCAPAFMLLAGAGAYLALGRGRTRNDLSWYLLTRGVWLLVLEFTVARFGWQFNLDYGYSAALVFWALGWSMIALAGLSRLPVPAIAAIGIGMIVGHNLLDGVEPSTWGNWSWLWVVLHSPGSVSPAPGTEVFMLYSLVPWIGVMAAGYAFGVLYQLPSRKRRRWLVGLGTGLVLVFIGLRAAAGYGDPRPFTVQETPLLSAALLLRAPDRARARHGARARRGRGPPRVRLRARLPTPPRRLRLRPRRRLCRLARGAGAPLPAEPLVRGREAEKPERLAVLPLKPV
jgi:uncharacterized membrane protein